MKMCKLFDIDTYIERRRGTLRKFLTGERKELWESIKGIEKQARNPNKILWWEQKYTTKDDMEEI